MKRISQALLFALVFSLLFVTASWSVSFRVVDLGPGEAVSINSSGQLAGYASASGGYRAAVWNSSGGRIILNTPEGVDSSASCINDSGVVVGNYPGEYDINAFVWSTDFGVMELPRMGGDGSDACAINNPGQIVGWSTTLDNWVNGCIWSGSGEITDLGEGLYGGYDINDDGNVVGEYSGHAFVWSEGGGLQYLQELTGHTGSCALGVNNSGQVVGWSYEDTFTGRAVLWNAEGQISDLGVLRRCNSSYGSGINNRGDVVGWSYNAPYASGSTSRAFFWSTATGMVELSPLKGHKNCYAYAINDAGQIAGSSEDRYGNLRAVVWTPGR